MHFLRQRQIRSCSLCKCCLCGRVAEEMLQAAAVDIFTVSQSNTVYSEGKMVMRLLEKT